MSEVAEAPVRRAAGKRAGDARELLEAKEPLLSINDEERSSLVLCFCEDELWDGESEDDRFNEPAFPFRIPRVPPLEDGIEFDVPSPKLVDGKTDECVR